MAKVREMQGTPAQLEYLKSDGKRRHIARCIFSEHRGNRNYLCQNPLSPIHLEECHTCRNCSYYEEEEN